MISNDLCCFDIFGAFCIFAGIGLEKNCVRKLNFRFISVKEIFQREFDSLFHIKDFDLIFIYR